MRVDLNSANSDRRYAELHCDTSLSRFAMSVPAAFIARLHTFFAATAFLSALIVGCVLHYKRIVKNDVAEYPEEWFPSVSATYGHRRVSSTFHSLLAA